MTCLIETSPVKLMPLDHEETIWMAIINVAEQFFVDSLHRHLCISLHLLLTLECCAFQIQGQNI